MGFRGGNVNVSLGVFWAKTDGTHIVTMRTNAPIGQKDRVMFILLFCRRYLFLSIFSSLSFGDDLSDRPLFFDEVGIRHTFDICDADRLNHFYLVEQALPSAQDNIRISQ